MAIPPRQIGWSDKANMLWKISKQLEILTSVFSKVTISITDVEELDGELLTNEGSEVLTTNEDNNNITINE